MTNSQTLSPEAQERLEQFIESHELCRNQERKDELRNMIYDLLVGWESEITLNNLEIALEKVQRPKALSLDIKSGELKYAEQKAALNTAGPNDFSSGTTFYYMFFTILLPFAAIIIELLYRPFTQSFFDPLPDFLHLILCALPPLSNLITYFQLKRNKVYNPKMLLLQNAAIAASFYYCLYFAPLSPLSALGILLMGAGFLSLSPLFGFSGVLCLRKRYYLSHEIKVSRFKHSFTAVIILFSLLILNKMPSALTEYGISQYLKASDPSSKAAAASFIRSWGSSQHILKKSQRGFGSGTAAVGDLPINNHVSHKKLNQLYFRVTGKIPHRISSHSFITGARAHSREMSRRWTWDSDIGDQEIGDKQEDLLLVSSQFDSKLDADPAIAYSEWVMEFENNHQFQNREARMEILLPDQAVVSRLTLWVNGEEREAAFAKTSKVKSAYKNIVRQNRDPVLVTWSAKNRIFVQCFPVLPQKRMKIRIGISSPMPLSQDKSKAYFYPPQILASNYYRSPSLKHDIWLEAKQKFAEPTLKILKIEQSATNHSLRGSLLHQDMTQSFRAELPRADLNEFWGRDLHDEQKLITSKIRYGSPFKRQKFFVLIDGSTSLAKEKQALASTLKKLITNPNFQIYIASDELIKVNRYSDFDDYSFEGGYDNLHALNQLIELTDQQSSIIWLHGPQPYELSSSSKLNQYQKRRGLVPIRNFQFNEGANKVIQEIKSSPHYSNLAASNRAELIALFELMLKPSEWPVFERQFVDAESYPKTAPQASSHLCRLMVSDEVNQTYFSDRSDHDKMASKAALYQLVTPLSGAVVLETQAQYDAAGLEAVDPSTVPTVPEPETWALIIILSLLLIYYHFKNKQKLAPARA